MIFASGYVSNETGIWIFTKLVPNCLILPHEFNHNSIVGVFGIPTRKGRYSVADPADLLVSIDKARKILGNIHV